MATTYDGREEEFDLGGGHSFRWFSDKDGVFGLLERHFPNTLHYLLFPYCGGYIAWRVADISDGHGVRGEACHQLLSGGPGDEEHVTVAPSLLCRQCGSHGFIRDGKWTDA